MHIFLALRSQTALQNKFQASQGYIEKPCLEKKETNKNQNQENSNNTIVILGYTSLTYFRQVFFYWAIYSLTHPPSLFVSFFFLSLTVTQDVLEPSVLLP